MISNMTNRNRETVRDDMQKIFDEVQAIKMQPDDNYDQLFQQLKNFNQDYLEETNYFKEFWRMYVINEYSIRKINDLTDNNHRLQEMLNEIDVKEQNSFFSVKKFQLELQNISIQKHKKKNRRTSQEIEKAFTCPYEKCAKLYGSEVSLNLHIKLKHEGGNKTDREKLAKMIIQAQDKGEDVPDVNIKFPPGYLDVFYPSIFKNQEFKEQLTKEKSTKSKNSKVGKQNHTIFYDD